MSLSLRTIAELLRRESGIRLGEHQHGALCAALGRAAPGIAPEAFLRLAKDPVRGSSGLEHLIDEITVQESAFLRERDTLERLCWPELLRSAQASGSAVVRVWVAGCANGEEAYTLAMLACEAFGGSHPPVSILATDISRRALAGAREGTYRERALRELSPERRSRWLREADAGRMAVGDGLRGLVHFRHHNLARESIPPAGEVPFQLVMCRNVLIYFDPAVAREIRTRLEAAVAPGGELLLGVADAVTAAAAPDEGLLAAPPPIATVPASAPPPVAGREELLARARAAAEEGNTGEALARVDALLERDPLDAGAHSLRGIVALAAGDANEATVSLRRALFAEPGLGPAAYMLGCAHDAAGRPAAARTAYAQALETLDAAQERHAAVFGDLDLAGALHGCRARLEGSAG